MSTAISRRVLLGGSALLAGALATGRPVFGQDGKFTMKCGANAPEQTPHVVRLRAAFAAIKEETGGQLDIQMFPASQLGSDNDMFLQVRSGAIDLMLNAGTNMSTLAPKASIAAVAFAFKDYDMVWAAMDGDLGAQIRQEVNGIGLVCLPKAFDVGFRQITNSVRAIDTPADMKGLKIRSPQSDIYFSMFRGLGAAPVAKTFSEVYQSLQTKLLDGQENSLALIQITKMYEVQKYISMTNHGWEYQWMIANQKKWGALPDNLRIVAEKHIDRAAVLQREDWAALMIKADGFLKEKGMAFNTPDRAAFKDALVKSGYYSEWQKKFGADAWATLERYSGKLG
jgi:TRAP-type transport system periplasmic protein